MVHRSDRLLAVATYKIENAIQETVAYFEIS